jgi:hypothetical protein
MIRNLFVAIAVVLLFGSTVFAEGLKLEDGQDEYVTKFITAKNVKGVKIGLSKEVFKDCNQSGIDLTHALVSGDGDGWHDKHFLDGYLTQTMMFCPPDTAVRETIYSSLVFIKSFANENVNNEIHISVVIPKGFELKVVEVGQSSSEEEYPDADPSK